VNTRGNPPHLSSFTSQAWKRGREAIGRPDLRWHDLRHTAVALAIANGAHPKAIQERMGHSSITVTLDRFGHLFPSLGVAVADGLEATFRAATEGGASRATVTESRVLNTRTVVSVAEVVAVNPLIFCDILSSLI
jgi:hypothetical protein